MTTAFATARLTYLAAMGIAAPAAMAGCKSTEPPPTVTAPSASATPTIASAAPDATPPVPPPLPIMGSCPNGRFCVPAPATVAPDAAAPAPYASCAETAVDPEDPTDAGPPRKFVTFNAEDTAAERAKNASACCYRWMIPCPGGRPLRETPEQPPVVAPQIARGDWIADIGAIATAPNDERARCAVAEHYAREAAFEHASIASFSEATIALMAVGAPPDLLAELQRAALDEIDHAKIAFALARAFGGEARGPAALPIARSDRAPTLVAIARSTFADGCVGESVAELVVREGARLAKDPALAALLTRVANDEARHAALAWKTLAWAVRAGGEEVAAAIAADADALQRALDGRRPGSTLDGDGDLAAFGVVGASAREAIEQRALAEVVLPCVRSLLTMR